MSRFEDFITRLGVRARPGATEAEIAGFERATGLQLPKTFRELYRQYNGLEFAEGGLKLLSLSESLEYFNNLENCDLTKTWGYIPFLDNEDSNPWCICCTGPLTGYIVMVSHDDGARVKFRSLDELFEGLLGIPEDDRWYLDDMEGSFDGTERTSQDVQTARSLLSGLSSYSESDQRDACRFALWLLSEDQVDEIIPLLDYPDEYIQREAVDRLTGMQSPKAVDALKQSQKRFADFVEQAVEILKQRGVPARVLNKEMTVNIGGIFLNMEMFYAERHKPGAMEHIVERAKFFIQQKQR